MPTWKYSHNPRLVKARAYSVTGTYGREDEAQLVPLPREIATILAEAIEVGVNDPEGGMFLTTIVVSGIVRASTPQELKA